MTSVTQMSFQNKAAGLPALLFRNDRPSGTAPFLGPKRTQSEKSAPFYTGLFNIHRSLVLGPWTSRGSAAYLQDRRACESRVSQHFPAQVLDSTKFTSSFSVPHSYSPVTTVPLCTSSPRKNPWFREHTIFVPRHINYRAILRANRTKRHVVTCPPITASPRLSWSFANWAIPSD
jgi:hypothetical protein